MLVVVVEDEEEVLDVHDNVEVELDEVVVLDAEVELEVELDVELVVEDVTGVVAELALDPDVPKAK